MKMLALDTSSAACSVALLNETKWHVVHEVAPMQQTRQLLAMIQTLLTDSALALDELDAIAYGCGPGSFTGVRIANSVAQGLGYGLNKPLIPISSMAAIAKAAHLKHQWRHILAALDARSDQIYWAAYSVSDDGDVVLLCDEQSIMPGQAAFPDRADVLWYGVGDGWSKYKQTLVAALGKPPAMVEEGLLPSAEAVLMLAKLKLERGEGCIAAVDANPTYLR